MIKPQKHQFKADRLTAAPLNGIHFIKTSNKIILLLPFDD
jgi:hypothetical protein